MREGGLCISKGRVKGSLFIKSLLKRIEEGKIDPSFGITHRGNLEDKLNLHKLFN